MTNAKPQQVVENAEQYHDPEEGMMVEVAHSTLIDATEIDMQIATARRYPRSLKAFRDQITELVTLDENVARSCIYVVPRDNKNIEGPSARFAELLMSCWGNNRTGGRIVGADEEFVTGQGFFFDLEKNVAITYEVKTSITKRNGERFSQDMIGVAGSAAASKAHRNAVLKGIPRALWSYAFDKAKEVVAGTQETLSARRVKMMKDLMLVGPTKDQIFGLIGVKGIDDITLDHMVTLGGVYTALKEGGTTVEEAFSPERMKAAGVVTPREPTRSEFRKADKPSPKKDAKKPPAAKATEKGKAAPKEDPKPVASAKQEAASIQQQPEQDPREFDRLDFIKDLYAELDLQTKVTLVADLMARGIDAGAFRSDEQKAWEKACDEKNKAIMQAARAKR